MNMDGDGMSFRSCSIPAFDTCHDTSPPHIIVGNHSFKDLALAVVCIQMFMNIWVCKWSGIFRNHNLLYTQIVWTTYVLRTYVCIHTSHYKSTSTQLRKDTSTQVYKDRSIEVYRIQVCTYVRIIFHYITLHLHYTTLHYITLHYTTLHYITLHCTTLHYIGLDYITLHCIYITLHYTTLD